MKNMFLHSKDDKINNVQDIATEVEENHLDQYMFYSLLLI